MAITDQREVAKIKTAKPTAFKVVQLQKVNGTEVVDIREFLQDAPSSTRPEGYTGFTKSGVSFPVEQIPELVEELNRAFAARGGNPIPKKAGRRVAKKS